MDILPELIVFLEVSSTEIINLTKDVEPICQFHYPYEHHVTIGWFTDKNPETLRRWGDKTVTHVKKFIHHWDQNFLDRSRNPLPIVIESTGRQPFERGGGFFLQPMDQSAHYLHQLHNDLNMFLQRAQIQISPLIQDYHPHITITMPITQDIVNHSQEKVILETLNNKIAQQEGAFPKKLAFTPTVIRSILKYRDELGNEMREVWES
jgi:2'-5' RNA ligase